VAASSLYEILEQNYQKAATPDFIPDDPILLVHRFSKKQDIEIAALFAATLAWGLRKTIIAKCSELFERMDNRPYEFVLHYQSPDLKPLRGFKHRTFQDTDLFYFLDFLQKFYQKNESLEQLFAVAPSEKTVEKGLIRFHQTFFAADYAPLRTRKHVASPAKKSACKRLSMFLRWLVRKDAVDLGIWKNIKPRQLTAPLDVHVSRTARQLGLLQRPKDDWQAVLELTESLRQFDPQDPIRYDLALFSMGLPQKVR
jgi:uncharacterized protein (TIGR02757 family)